MRSKFCFFREVLQCLWGHLFNLFCPQADTDPQEQGPQE